MVSHFGEQGSTPVKKSGVHPGELEGLLIMMKPSLNVVKTNMVVGERVGGAINGLGL